MTEGRLFRKMHGLGNDFVVIDARTEPFAPTPAAIRAICNRHTGVGGDQLLVIEPASAGADARMRIYNIDGTESQTCLNATRCVTWLLLTESGLPEMKLETLGGEIIAHHATAGGVSLELAPPRWDWQAVPLNGPADTLDLPITSGPLSHGSAVSLGNPHVVFFVPERDAVDVPRWAAPVQADPRLPESANVGVAELVAPDRIRLVVYERPGILTQACGSGSLAAALVARRRGLTQARQFTVEMPGGALSVTIHEDERMTLTGPVATAFTGTLSPALQEAA